MQFVKKTLTLKGVKNQNQGLFVKPGNALTDVLEKPGNALTDVLIDVLDIVTTGSRPIWIVQSITLQGSGE